MLALLGLVQAIKVDTTASTEANRFFNSNGEAIILAETEGHARIELTKDRNIEKFHPIEAINLMTEECRSHISMGALDDITHCPINSKGPIQAHIQ